MAPVYAVTGSDAFLRREAVERILRPARGADAETDVVRFDGTDFGPPTNRPPAAVLDEVRTPSLLLDHRIAVVDPADPLIKAHRTVLERYCGDPAATGTLVLVCASLRRTTRLYKAIAKCGKIVTVETPKGRALSSWTMERARTIYEKRLDADAARMLLDHVGNGVGTIDAELAKLAAYVGDRDRITQDDVGALTDRHREEKIFGVIDAIASADVSGALHQWEQVVATDRAAPGRAIAGLAWSVRRLLEARRDWGRGADIRELGRRLYTDPAVLRRRLERMSVDQLETLQRDLLSADLAVKTGAATFRTAIETFIVKHSACTAGAS